MAGLLWVQTYPETLSGVATKTLLQLAAPTNQRIRLWEVSFSTKGVVAADAPLLVDLLQQTTAGTMTANNPSAEVAGGAETVQTTGQRDATAEPTGSTVIRTWEIHPQGDRILYRALSLADAIVIAGGQRIGLRVVTPGVSVLVRAYIRGEE